MLRQRRAYAELQARRHRREEGGITVLDYDEEDEAGPSSAPPRVGDPGRLQYDGGDYTQFYRLIGM